MTKYLNFFESESGFTEAVEAGQLFFPNVSYTEEDDTVHWNLEQPADPVETPMLRMSFSTSSPGEGVKLTRYSDSNVTAMEIDGIPVNVSGGTYSIASPGNHTAVYQFASPAIPENLFFSNSGAFDTFTSAEITSAVTAVGYSAFVGCGGMSGVTIPDSVTTIGTQAFTNSGLRSVTIPDSVTTLGGYPFYRCTELRTAIVGSGVTAILNQTFGECTSLQSVTLPGSLTFIGYEVFINCHSLRDINIPSGVTTIDGNAFNGCSGLTAIYLNPETPPTLGANALDNTNNCPIYVPASSVEAYKQAWSAYASRIMPTGGVQYSITAEVNDETLGRVNLWKETASEGEYVDFGVIYNPYITQASSITVTDRNGVEIPVADEGNRVYSFTMPDSNVTISVVLEEKPEGQYEISTALNDDSLGRVDVLNGETANEGDQVDFDVVVPDLQYQVSVTVTDGNGNNVQVTDKGDNSYSFTMPASDVTISVVIGEKPKHTVTVDSTDDMVTDVNFMSDDGQPSYKEGDMVNFTFNLPGDGQFYAASVQASDCDGNSIEVELVDDGDGMYNCTFYEMPGCDVSVFITVEERPMYSIMASLNDNSLGHVDVRGSAPEGGQVEFDVVVFEPDANQVTSVTVTDGNGDEVEYTGEDYGGGIFHYHFTMPASDVTISVAIEPKQ